MMSDCVHKHNRMNTVALFDCAGNIRLEIALDGKHGRICMHGACACAAVVASAKAKAKAVSTGKARIIKGSLYFLGRCRNVPGG